MFLSLWHSVHWLDGWSFHRKASKGMQPINRERLCMRDLVDIQSIHGRKKKITRDSKKGALSTLLDPPPFLLSSSFPPFFFFDRQPHGRRICIDGANSNQKRELSVFYTNSSNQKHKARCFFFFFQRARLVFRIKPTQSIPTRVLLLFVVCISEKNSYIQELKSLHSLNSFQSS